MDSDSESDDPFDDSASESSISIDGDEVWLTNLRMIKENDPRADGLFGNGDVEAIQNMTNEEWEELGRDIAANNYFWFMRFTHVALNDHKMSFLFRGLNRSSSIKNMNLYDNGFGVAGIRSMVPFLQNANNLKYLFLYDNNIQSEGFNLLFRALCDSPIEKLQCNRCDIESIEVGIDHIPKNLKVKS